jgi:hypothetical protein
MDKNAGKTELAIWLAAFIDADGMVGIHKQPNNGNGQLCPRIVISTACEKTRDFLGDAFAALEIGHYITHRRGQKAGWMDTWVIVIAGMKRCKKTIETLLPYFVTKEEEARLVLQFIEERLSYPMRRGYTPGQLAIVERIKDTKLNRNFSSYAGPTKVKLVQ